MVKTQGRFSREPKKRSGAPQQTAHFDTHEMARVLGRRGGLASMAGRTPEQRRALASMAGKASAIRKAKRRTEAASV